MELVREREATQMTETELEAQKHNAQISERYRKLQSAEADQFSSNVYAEPVHASVMTPDAPVFVAPVNETPVMEQTPQVTDFVHERITSSIFTSEKFDRLQDRQEEVACATIAPAYAAPVFEESVATVSATEERYALTPLAKIVMAIFTVVVVAMLALIGVNSHIIDQKKIKLKNLEEKREQLVDQYDEIQQRIEAAQSEESIRAWAESQGMVQAGN